MVQEGITKVTNQTINAAELMTEQTSRVVSMFWNQGATTTSPTTRNKDLSSSESLEPFGISENVIIDSVKIDQQKNVDSVKACSSTTFSSTSVSECSGTSMDTPISESSSKHSDESMKTQTKLNTYNFGSSSEHNDESMKTQTKLTSTSGSVNKQSNEPLQAKTILNTSASIQVNKGFPEKITGSKSTLKNQKTESQPLQSTQRQKSTISSTSKKNIPQPPPQKVSCNIFFNIYYISYFLHNLRGELENKDPRHLIVLQYS